jgi:hypothetical protein
MAHNLTELDIFSSTVTVPDGGDPRTAASVELPFQSVANRTINLRNRINNIGSSDGIVVTHSNGIQARGCPVMTTGEFVYIDAFGVLTPKPHTIQVPLTHCVRTGVGHIIGVINDSGNSNAVAISAPVLNDGFLYDLALPSGSELTAVSAGVVQLNAGATVDMQLWVYSSQKDADMSGNPTVTSLGSDITPAGAGGKVLSVPVAASAYIQGPLTSLAIHIRASDSGLASDSVHWIQVSFKDPGPRNY